MTNNHLLLYRLAELMLEKAAAHTSFG